MSVGFPDDKNAIDSRTGSIAVQIRNLLTKDIPQVQAWLLTKLDTDLVTIGYTEQEVTILKSAFTELAALGQVATGAATAQTATNFLVFSNQLTSIN